MNAQMQFRHPARLCSRVLALLFILALVTVPLAQPAAAANGEFACVQYYTVQERDTLNSIAKKFTVKFNDLVAANKLKEPYTIFVGQELCIPKTSKIGAVGTGSSGATTALSFTITHNKNGFVIRTTNFPEKSNFLVKVDNLASPQVEWVKAGKLTTKKDGPTSFAFTLPNDLLKANFLHVCLKNQRTDDLFCKYSVRYVP
jgi:LysM repeat protein